MLLPEGEAKVIAFNTLNQELFDALGNKSIVQVLQENKHFGLYVGMTSVPLHQKDLRWLTKRGANTKAGRENGQCRETPGKPQGNPRESPGNPQGIPRESIILIRYNLMLVASTYK